MDGNSGGSTEAGGRSHAVHPLDQATALERQADGTLRGRVTGSYGNKIGQFGGATAATLLRAVVEDERRIGEPLSMTVNFCAPMPDGEFWVRVQPVKTGGSTQHWQVELRTGRPDDEAGLIATASAVTARRRATWSHRPASAPDMPPFDSLERLLTPGLSVWLDRYDMRYTLGDLRFAETADDRLSGARTHMWLADLPARPLDFISLMAMSDSFFARIFHVRGKLMPIGTVTMTTYFHCDGPELDAIGAAPLIGVADAKIFDRGFFDQTGELWAGDGRLLASTHQIVYFRD